jgi:NAD(P)-dependent dehydrogenase (short-subunit alcohol dehydrogenase family)
VSQTLPADSLTGKVALVTGSSRGIGADTIRYFAEAGADVVINFRNKAPAPRSSRRGRGLGRRALVVGADLTDPGSVAGCAVRRSSAASTSWSSTRPAAWRRTWARTTLRLNRDAQVNVLEGACREGGRIVFVTSHQAHFIRTADHARVRAGRSLEARREDALRELIPAIEAKGSSSWSCRAT